MSPRQRRSSAATSRELAGDLLPDAPRLAREMNEHRLATMQELRGRRPRRCLGGIRAARGGGSRRICAARGDPGRRRATRPRPRRLPAPARRGAGGRARRGAGGGAAAAVTRYERVELVSLLASDFPRARAFVAARLGPLAAATEAAARLRGCARPCSPSSPRTAAARGRPRSPERTWASPPETSRR